eukprot:Skav233338  [mRNA]  locus=scaffold394:119005:121007:+ [translate_table: standard]
MPGETPGPGSYTQVVAGLPLDKTDVGLRTLEEDMQLQENRPPSPAKGVARLSQAKEVKDDLQQQLREEERLRAQAEQRVKQCDSQGTVK